MTPVSSFNPNACIRDWLIRVDTQYDETTPEKVKKADYDRAKESLGLGNITNNYFFSSARPALYIPPQQSRGWFSSGDTTTNSHNTTNVYNTTHIHNAPVSSDSDEITEGAKAVNKKKNAKEEKTNWKGIAAIGVVSTAVAGISIFVYARLSKAAEGAVNYLENTKRVQQWAQDNEINKIAHTQLEIDQRAADKITNYKYSILTSLVGTLALAGGGITILASAPALATAGTAAVIAGGVLNSIAVMYAAYNCGMHWSDEEEGKKAFNEVKQLIPDLIRDLNKNPQFSYASEQQPVYNREHEEAFLPHDGRQEQWGATCSPESSQPPYNPNYWNDADLQSGRFPENPPSYDESQAIQAIYNQRAGIYPDLRATVPMEMQELSRTKY